MRFNLIFSLLLTLQVDKLGKDSLVNCAKTSMSSKLIAADSDFFANLVSFLVPEISSLQLM